ncbi:hypothetical protein BJ912DRAFT_1046084 [Pholiota molesta]|nr:hypothetical protein BJ912DRAFT_1046084 [Pholiota molesta]
MNRSIIVDNNAASIVYSGPWLTSERGLLLSPGTLGTPSYSNTVHMITTTGSFKYPFRGSKIMVVGYMPNLNTKIPEPWNCAIDGNTISNTPVGTVEPTPLLDPNAFSLCSWRSSTDSDSDSHNLTVTITNADQDRPFYFDYIEYSPLRAQHLIMLLSLLTQRHGHQIQRRTMDLVPLGMATSGPISQFTFTFKGVSLALYGYRGSAMANATIDGAAYFVDNDNPVSFDLSPSDANCPTHGGVSYKSTPTLNSSPELTATSGPSRQKLTPVAGGVIAGLVILLALVLLASFILLRRRRRKNDKANAPVLLHNLFRKSKIAPHPNGQRHCTGRHPAVHSCVLFPVPLVHIALGVSQEPHASVNGYWDAISLGRRTHGNSMAPSPWDDGLAENGLLQRPENLGSPGGSDAQAGRMSSNPAVALEAHKRALRQLLGIGPGVGSPDGLRPVVDGAIREDEDAGRSRWSESTIKPSVLERAPK